MTWIPGRCDVTFKKWQYCEHIATDGSLSYLPVRLRRGNPDLQRTLCSVGKYPVGEVPWVSGSEADPVPEQIRRTNVWRCVSLWAKPPQ